ncbi:hypothetical protein V8F20_003698 [Naviculisporaceae sp. PSN 640]
MDPNKRRKLEDGSIPGHQVSAFAARQKLLGLASPLDKSTARNDVRLDGNSVEGPDRPAQPKSPRKSKRKVAQARVDSPLPEAADATSTPIVAGGLEAPDSVPPTPVLSPLTGLPVPESRAKPTTLYSSLKPTNKTYQRKADGLERLELSDGERLVILGSYGVQVQTGELTVGGAILVPSKTIHWVHAPNCHALPVIRVKDELASKIVLHPHPAARGLRQLSLLNPAFGKLWNEENAQEGTPIVAGKDTPTFKILFAPQDHSRRAMVQHLNSPGEWNKKLAGLVAARKKGTPVVFLCGPKSSGKSTFGRLLTNRLVTDHGGYKNKPWSAVIVLDLDPGQPEYGPPGVISINKISAPVLSPPFCHPSDGFSQRHIQLRAHAVAAVSPAQDPDHFIESALQLFSHYQQSVDAKFPLLVNTPGWIQGTGLDILSELIRRISPTEVIYMSEEGPEETVESLKSVCSSSIPFNTLRSQSSENTPRTSINLRILQTMSYFHLDQRLLAASKQEEPQHHVWDPTRLSEMRPWRVRYKGANRGFVGILCYDYQPAPNLLTEAINGMILALVRIENNAAFRDLLGSPPSYDNVSWTEEGIPIINNPLGRTLDPRYSRALGLVLVRGLDVSRGELQLLTPLPIADLVPRGETETGLVLVAGKFDTPTWAYAEDLYWRTSTEEGLGEEEDDDDDDKAEGGYDAKGPLSQGLKAGPSTQTVPWVELHHGSQKRSVGSRVWRVRRDLGRS